MATPPDFTAGSVLTAAQMNAVGLWRIAGATFTSQTQLELDNVFSADYLRYRLVFNTTSASGDVTLKFKTSTGVTTASNYGWAQWGMSLPAATASDFALAGQAQIALTSNYGNASVDIFCANEAQPTVIHGNTTFLIGSDTYLRCVASRWTGSDVFVGMRINMASSASGRWDVYGYRD